MKKIMFNDKYGLTKAVLEGRKTQTRRIVGDSLIDEYENWLSDAMCIAVPSCTTFENIEDLLINRSKYFVGEIVAIAQSYRDIGYTKLDIDGECITKAGLDNKMFVRAEMMPNKIRITNVRIERLQDISDEDCIKEGVELNTRQYQYDGTKYYCVRGLGHWRSFGCNNYNSPRDAYAALIDKVSGKGTWERNPYVWVYDFELIK